MFWSARTSNKRTRMLNICFNSTIVILCLVFIKLIFCEEDASPSIHSDIEYVYKYETKIFQKSGGGSEGVHNFKIDERKIDETLYNFASDSLHIAGMVKVAKIWTGKKKSLVRFQIDEIAFAAKRNSKTFSEKTSQDVQKSLDPGAQLIFYAIFDSDCQPNKMLVSEPKIDELTPASQVNFFRGILNQFKYEAKNWSGRQQDFYGTCDVSQTFEDATLNVEKTRCIKPQNQEIKNFKENVLGEDNLFATNVSRSMRQEYQFLSAEPTHNLCPRTNKDENDYKKLSHIMKVKTIESLKANLKHHHNIGTFVQSSQEFTFKEHVKLSPDEALIVDSDDPSIEYLMKLIKEKTGKKVTEHELIPAVDTFLATKFGHKIVSSSQIKKVIAKNKSKLKSKFLATKNSAKAFSHLRKLFSSDLTKEVTKEDLKILLTDIKNKDIWPQLMDVFGSSRNTLAHEAAMEVFGNPTQTKHPDLCERYLWALSQLENCPEKVTKDLMKFVNGKIVNDKLLETTVFTIAALSRTTRNAKVTASLLKWLVESLSKCKSPECLQLYVNALQNTYNEKLAPLLFNLVEDNCRTEKGQSSKKAKGRRKVAIAAMKGLAAMKVDEVFAILDNQLKKKGMLTQKFLTLFRNKDVDTNIRGLIVEMLVLKSSNKPDDRISIITMEGIIKYLAEDRSSSGREFLGFMMSRLNELATEDAYLKKLLGQLASKGVINWDVISSGSFSSTFGRHLSSSSAGKIGVSFGLEVSGMMLKRSNLEFFFNTEVSEGVYSRTRLVQMDTFAGGMSSYFGTGKENENDDDEKEPYAGLQLMVRKNKLRPFIFFRSSSEIMSLYWSGALEEKTSALSGNMMLEDENQLLFFSNGMIVNLMSNGVISFDSSGQAKVSIWSKTANTKIENSGTYVLEYASNINFFHPTLFISHKENLDIPMGLNSETEGNFGGEKSQMCIKIHQPSLSLSYERTQIMEFGHKNKTSKYRRETYVNGKTIPLTTKVMDLCNKMHPKRR